MAIVRQQKGKKVFVGMSGGVDSSVSAALLQRAGYDVTGVFIQVWQADWVNCTSKEDRREAMKAAAYLGIPFITLDLTETYKREVVDYMIAEYKAGRTPNPDVMCNRHVKFGDFYKWAKKQGADYVATGHYAQTVQIGEQTILVPGKDMNKDQSYFLWTLTSDELSNVLFPVGHLDKPEVRKLATKFALPNATRKDSQGLCFIGKLDVKDFLRDYVSGAAGSTPGKVLNEAGEIIGHHNGAIFYTIGERHGFQVFTKSPTEQPYFVVGKNLADNTVTVAHKNQTGILPSLITSAELENVNLNQVVLSQNWLQKQREDSRTDERFIDLDLRIRYRSPLVKGRLIIPVGFETLKQARIEFFDKVSDLAVGQSVVFYFTINGNGLCLGGGVAARVRI